jgi:hypothetical protein
VGGCPASAAPDAFPKAEAVAVGAEPPTVDVVSSSAASVAVSVAPRGSGREVAGSFAAVSAVSPVSWAAESALAGIGIPWPLMRWERNKTGRSAQNTMTREFIVRPCISTKLWFGKRGSLFARILARAGT